MTNDWYFYPQALVKQLDHDAELVYNTYDIIAEFNSDFPFWFVVRTNSLNISLIFFLE